jgi:hypothetical protein
MRGKTDCLEVHRKLAHKFCYFLQFRWDFTSACKKQTGLDGVSIPDPANSLEEADDPGAEDDMIEAILMTTLSFRLSRLFYVSIFHRVIQKVEAVKAMIRACQALDLVRWRN